jgi:hypothetical protein
MRTWSLAEHKTNAQNSADWARETLDAHKSIAGIDEGDDTCQIWHLLISLVTFCQVEGIDIDKQLAGAKHWVKTEQNHPTHLVSRGKRK